MPWRHRGWIVNGVNLKLSNEVITQCGHAWTHAVARGASPTRFDVHTFRFQIQAQLSPKTQTTLILSHESRDSNKPFDSYEENVVSLTLSRNF